MRRSALLVLTLSMGCSPAHDWLSGLGGAGARNGTYGGTNGVLNHTDMEPADTGLNHTDMEHPDPAGDTVDASELLPVIRDCAIHHGYEVDTAIFGTEGPALWLTGIYETHGEHAGGDHPMGYGTVAFDLPGDNILALSSYEPVTWNLALGPDAEITEILLFGYHEQLVENAGDVPVTFVDSASGLSSCGYSLPYNGGGCDTDELIAQVEDAAGRDLSRFDGCYQASDVRYGLPTPDPVDVVEPSSLDEVVLDCATDAGYEVDTWLGEASEQAVWLAAVYETHSNHGGGVHPMGEASVVFDLPGDHVLALSSYEPVTWNLELGADAGLTEIVVFGYHEQIVEGAGDIPVTFYGDPACGYSLPYNGGGCDTDELIDAVEAETGRSLSRFDGCYRATEFQFVVDDGRPSGPSCAAGETVELSIDIPAEAMAQGASDPSGAGRCTGEVTFFDDLDDISTQATWDYVSGELVHSEFNGYAASCGSAHCNDLVYGDGDVRDDYCTILAVCEDGVARTTGFTW